MITFNNIVERFEIFAQNHFFIKTFSFGSPDDADLSKFTDFPLMHLVYTGANYDAGTKTYNIEVYILDVPADKNDKVERQKEVVSDAEQCAEDIIADIKNGGNIFLFAQDYEVVNATTTPLEEETKNVLSGVLLDLSVAIPYEWDACNAPIDGVEPGGTEVTYARRGVLRMLTIDGTTDVQSVRTINVTNGTLTDDGDGVVTLDTGGAETLNDLTDVDTTGVTNGQVLKYDNASGEWLPGNDQSATSLGNLDDVSIVTPANREALIYDGSEWVNDTVAKGDIGLGNVDNTSDADKPVSTATQTALNAKANTADVPTSLNDLSDVSIVGTPTGNQALIYDATANAFKSQVSYTNRFEDDVETGKQGITGTERAYSVKGEGDGVFIDPESDTPAAGKVIVRKIYHKTGFITDADVIGDYTLIHTFADDTAYADTVATFEGFEDGATYGVPPFTLLQTWEEVAAAPTFTGLLNESYGSGAAAAYGTRRLNGNYSGACMTIRRASDGTTQAIGFVGEEIDESAITTFCTGTSCTVQVWHDQSQTGGTGSGNDATQTTPANQPTIYTGGALVKEGGRVAIQGTSSTTELVASISHTITAQSTFGIGTYVYGASDRFISQNNGGNDFGASDAYIIGFADGTNSIASYINSAARSSITVSENQHIQFTSIHSGSSLLNAVNGTTGTAYAHTLNSTFSRFGIMGTGGSVAQGWQGKFQEVVMYTSDKSTDRTDIEGNISAYYQSAKLLDESFGSGAEAAYSTRQLRRDQTDCMVIRRASDSTTTTIGFDSNGNIDEAAINTFCSGTTCTVYQWLDQSGNGNTATAAAQANEPTIYTGGALVKENGKVAVTFDGSNDGFPLDTTSLDIGSLSSFTTGKFNATSGSGMMLGLSGGGSNKRWYAPYLANTNFNFGYANSGTAVNTGADTNRHLFTMIAGTTLNSMQAWASSASVGTATLTTGIDSTKNGIGNLNGTLYGNCNVQESIFYTSDKSSVRTSIESNVGDYFTQNTPLLDTYTGAAAAYSLRLLDSTYTGSAIRVRRSSDNAEQDINFNVFGELDTVSLLAFAGTGDAFVKTWYDQSGNSNDATQTATGSQPKIVSSGAVIVENGKPAVEFDGTDDKLDLTGFTQSASNYSLHAVTKDTSNDMFLFDAQSGRLVFDGRGGGRGVYYDGSWEGTSHSGTSQQLQSIYAISPSSGQSYVDGSQVNTGLPYTQTPIGGGIALGGNYQGSGHCIFGVIQEFILYPSDESANRSNIETNIATFYDITI